MAVERLKQFRILPRILGQYDPELSAGDRLGIDYARRRLQLGYGTPPVSPQVLGNVRARVLETFPALRNFPTIRRMLEA